jgi:murein peptide amidase A
VPRENPNRLARRVAALALFACALFATLPGGASAGKRVTIGHSILGRPLVATVKGSLEAPTRILAIGCVHGDETAGLRVARRLVGSAAPAKAALWIVPSLNPDGVAAGTRGNARGVDLNRNFPFHWRPLDGLEYSGNGPLSEPESRAAWRLIRRTKPDVTIWFHQPFGLVDRSGGAPAIERRYAELVGLPLVRLRRYPGSASSWQNHALPRSSAFVVELPAVASSNLIGRAARAVTTLAGEYASAEVGEATEVELEAERLRLPARRRRSAPAPRRALPSRP